MSIKNFSIFKVNEKKNEKSPDYSISVKHNDKYVTIGGCWLKDGKSGKYFSCKLSDGYKEIRGFSITLDEPMAIGSSVPEKDIPPQKPPIQYPKRQGESSIPF